MTPFLEPTPQAWKYLLAWQVRRRGIKNHHSPLFCPPSCPVPLTPHAPPPKPRALDHCGGILTMLPMLRITPPPSPSPSPYSTLPLRPCPLPLPFPQCYRDYRAQRPHPVPLESFMLSHVARAAGAAGDYQVLPLAAPSPSPGPLPLSSPLARPLPVVLPPSSPFHRPLTHPLFPTTLTPDPRRRRRRLRPPRRPLDPRRPLLHLHRAVRPALRRHRPCHRPCHRHCDRRHDPAAAAAPAALAATQQ